MFLRLAIVRLGAHLLITKIVLDFHVELFDHVSCWCFICVILAEMIVKGVFV